MLLSRPQGSKPTKLDSARSEHKQKPMWGLFAREDCSPLTMLRKTSSWTVPATNWATNDKRTRNTIWVRDIVLSPAWQTALSLRPQPSPYAHVLTEGEKERQDMVFEWLLWHLNGLFKLDEYWYKWFIYYYCLIFFFWKLVNCVSTYVKDYAFSFLPLFQYLTHNSACRKSTKTKFPVNK